EKLNADLGTLFFTNVSPNASEIAALGEAEKAPALEGVTYANAAGNDPYGIAILGTTNGQISTGPYEGLIALKTEYELSASARTSDGGEAVMKRRVETVAIPVFQFGIFSDVDLSFHAGPNFNFGGRVHTNGNLFLAHGDGNTLTLPEKVTAVKEIVRSQLANGVNITASDHEGTISMARAPGS